MGKKTPIFYHTISNETRQKQLQRNFSFTYVFVKMAKDKEKIKTNEWTKITREWKMEWGVLDKRVKHNGKPKCGCETENRRIIHDFSFDKKRRK